MNFCVTDGVSVVATRYVSSRNDAAASLVCALTPFFGSRALSRILQWFSSGTAFSEYAEGGHYKMSKADKRENIIMVRPRSSRRRNTHNGCIFRLQASPLPSRKVRIGFHDTMRVANLQVVVFSGLDGDKD